MVLADVHASHCDRAQQAAILCRRLGLSLRNRGRRRLRHALCFALGKDAARWA